MNEANVTVLGDFIYPNFTDFEGSLSFCFKAGYLEKGKLWKSKDLSAEFLGDFWRNVLDIEEIKPKLHFICAELLENAVYHSPKSDYMIMIHLYFKTNELLVYVKNSVETEKTGYFKTFIHSLLETEDLQKLFVQRMKSARKVSSKKSQVGLITIMKDRGAKLSWKLEQEPEVTSVTTLARISLKKKEAK